MRNLNLLDKKHCRLCGIEYYANQPYGRDGFCSKAHKQAHYRAYKLYVTSLLDRPLSQKKTK